MKLGTNANESQIYFVINILRILKQLDGNVNMNGILFPFYKRANC